ncbi:hypothetical protein BBR47_49300 [Brevibacillus brevis NBRC 100599]|uniref:Uncharacterized protein n=2 Tax=Brevibacillus brevis TaxID=1393 RepID=C0ZL80_BREBN|nr:hypothetical protein BBR47_49300 [Brevibacillus brevis NBRC 100599]
MEWALSGKLTPKSHGGTRMEHDSVSSSSVPNHQEKEIPRQVKDELMYQVLEKDMTTAEQEKKIKDDYLKGKA